jgi:hypothetical protein
MNKLIGNYVDFFADCGFQYAICAGYALELFSNKYIRPHSDIDVWIAKADKKKAHGMFLIAALFFVKIWVKVFSACWKIHINNVPKDSVYRLSNRILLLLSQEQLNWLLEALVTAYPYGHKWAIP